MEIDIVEEPNPATAQEEAPPSDPADIVIEVVDAAPRDQLDLNSEGVLSIFRSIGFEGVGRSTNFSVYLSYEYYVISLVEASFVELISLVGSGFGFNAAMLGPLAQETRSAFLSGDREALRKSFVKSHAVSALLGALLTGVGVTYVFASPYEDPEAQALAKRFLALGTPIFFGVTLSLSHYNTAIAINKSKHMALIYFFTTAILAILFYLFADLPPFDRLLIADTIMVLSMLISSFAFVFDKDLVAALIKPQYWKKIVPELLPALLLGIRGAGPAISQLIFGSLVTLSRVKGAEKQAYFLLTFFSNVLGGTFGLTLQSEALSRTVTHVLHPAQAYEANARLGRSLRTVACTPTFLLTGLTLISQPLVVGTMLHGGNQSELVQDNMNRNIFFATVLPMLFMFVAIEQGFSWALDAQLNRRVTAALTAMPALAVLLGMLWELDSHSSSLTAFLGGNAIAAAVTFLGCMLLVKDNIKKLNPAPPAQIGFFSRVSERVAGAASRAVSGCCPGNPPKPR